MNSVAPLLIPTLRWDPSHGFSHLRAQVDDALETGVGGFLIQGGPRQAVAELAAELHARSPIPLLLAADVERGTGQQYEGCIALPPLGALGSLNDPDSMRRAARITARELKQLGLNWALAPVCDLDMTLDRTTLGAPIAGGAIVGTRAASSDAAKAASLLTDWVDACQAEGVLACAKHFPGHGRAAEDSHRSLPAVRAGADELWNDDLLPFRAALDAGVASMMTAHVAYNALDASGVPATLSEPIVTGLLRRDMHFDGLIVTDSLEMDGVLAAGGAGAAGAFRGAGAEAEVALRAAAAGCDLLLAPTDIGSVARALEQAVASGELNEARVGDSLTRRDRWALWGRPAPARESTLDDVMWARQAADRAVHLLRGAVPRIGSAVELAVVDDDADAHGAWTTPSREFFARVLHELEVEAPIVSEPSISTRMPLLIAAYADVVAWKGRAGFSGASIARIEHAAASAHTQRRETLIVLFSHPRHAAQLPAAHNVLCAWGGERPMQEAAARAVVRA